MDRAAAFLLTLPVIFLPLTFCSLRDVFFGFALPAALAFFSVL